MPVPNLLVKREPTGQVVHVQPATHQFGLAQYEKIGITKTGYLWGYLRLALIDGLNNDFAKEKLGFIGPGLLIESIQTDLIVLKKPKRNLKLYKEFTQDKKTMLWEKS